MRSLMLRVNDVDLSVLVTGEGGPSLVFLHYWGGSTRTWRGVMARLSATHHCVGIDFRGWGRSTKEATDHSLPTLADDVIGVIGHLGLTDFVLLGHSMGGKVAQLVAARHPQGLRQLILVAPAPPAPLGTSEQQRQGMLASYQTREGAEAAIDILAAVSLPAAEREQIVEDTLCGSQGAKRAWPELGMLEDITGEAARIRAPVTVIVGSADRIETEMSLRAEFGKVFPATRFVVIPGAGHLAPLEAPAEVSDAIRRCTLVAEEARST